MQFARNPLAAVTPKMYFPRAVPELSTRCPRAVPALSPCCPGKPTNTEGPKKGSTWRTRNRVQNKTLLEK